MAQAQAAGQDREYETIFILQPNVSRESSEGISARVAEAVSREGGKLTRVESWGRRRLAYPVGKLKRGVYVYLRFLGRGGLVAEVERNLRLADDVIKYQTVKIKDEVQRESVTVAPEDVKFEYVEMPEGSDADDSLARELGLEDGPDREEHKRHGFDEEAEALEEMGEGLDDEDDE